MGVRVAVAGIGVEVDAGNSVAGSSVGTGVSVGVAAGTRNGIENESNILMTLSGTRSGLKRTMPTRTAARINRSQRTVVKTRRNTPFFFLRGGLKTGASSSDDALEALEPLKSPSGLDALSIALCPDASAFSDGGAWIT